LVFLLSPGSEEKHFIIIISFRWSVT